MSSCPCGSGLDLNDCCAPLHYGRPAPTALALMRSRYTAFATGNVDYLEKTCSPEMRADFNREDMKRDAETAKWLGLKILRTLGGGENDDTGQVEFVASYKYNGRAHSQHELSDFRRIDGAWVFSGSVLNPKQETVVRQGEKTGRNDPCPCGSQKKYKKCCGAAK